MFSPNFHQRSACLIKNTIMGFPDNYTNIFLPKLNLYILTLLSFLHDLIYFILKPSNPTQSDQLQSLSVVLMRELLPIVKFSELVDTRDKCVVCLYEFDASDEIRGLMNCRHVFHRCCIDRWMDHDRKTCPLCRMPVIHEDLQDSFNERLWVASGIADYYGDFDSSPTDRA